MVTIKFIEPGGEERSVEARGGLSLMEAAINNGVDGIAAECGGACSCATCHVYVGQAWAAAAGDPSELEDELLSGVLERRPNSRLACQVMVSDGLDGAIIEIPGE